MAGAGAARKKRVSTRCWGAADLPVEPLLPLVVTAVPFDAVTAALERHPAMALAAAEIAREEAELARLQGERRPDFVVGGGYMLTPGDAGAWTARAGVTWPNAPWSRKRLRRRDRGAGAPHHGGDGTQGRRGERIRRGVQEAQVQIAAARERAELILSTLLPHVEHALECRERGTLGPG